MGKYRRVTLAVRCQIDALLQAGFSRSQISTKLGFHKSTISRELKRNFYFQDYYPKQADILAKQRYKNCRRHYKLHGDLLTFVIDALKFNWSPEQISGRLRREKQIYVSHECIYQLIRKHPDLKCLLRRPKRRGTGRITQQRVIRRFGISIHKRPKVINQRRRKGDWERDGIYGANRKQLLVCTERKTKYTKIENPLGKTSKSFSEATIRALRSTGKKVYSVTNDNGTEFRGAPLPYKTYYCEPMKPQQRGTVENTVGLIRQWIKRDTDLDKLSPEDLKQLEDRLNFRPRKCLNYRTPFEAFYNLKVALAY